MAGCPYCGSEDVKVGGLYQTVQKDDAYHMFFRAACRECGEPFYAVKSFYQKENEEYVYIMKQDLQEKYGVRHKRPIGRWV